MRQIIRLSLASAVALALVIGAAEPALAAGAGAGTSATATATASAAAAAAPASSASALTGLGDVTPVDSVDLPKTDQDYITALTDRFGVEIPAEGLQAVLDDPVEGQWAREQVKTALFGDIVLQGRNAEADVLNSMLNDMFNMMTGNVVAKIQQQRDRLVASVGVANGILAGADASDSNVAQYRDALLSLGWDKARDLSPQLQPMWDQLDSVTAFSDQIKKYASWGVKAESQQPWQALLAQYHELRSEGKSPADARAALETQDDLAPVYKPTIDMLTRNLASGAGDGSWASNIAVYAFSLLIPTSGLFTDRTELFNALESAQHAIMVANDPATQAAIGATLTLDALVLTQQTGKNRLFAVQTSTSKITVVNASPLGVTNVAFKTSAGTWGRIARIEPGAVAVVADPKGSSLDGAGTVTYTADGLASRTLALAAFSETAWAKGVTESGASSSTVQLTAGLIVTKVGFTPTWDFGDGQTATAVQGVAATHTYGCPGAYQPSLTAVSIGATVQVASPGVFTRPSPTGIDWKLTGTGVSGFRVTPGSTPTLTPTGLPAGIKVEWQIQDGVSSVDIPPANTQSGGKVQHTFAWSTLTSVTMVLSDAAGCTVGTVQKSVTVGSKTGWVKLPPVIWWSQTLDGNVGGYYSDSTVTINPGVTLTIVNTQLRTSAASMFSVGGTLDISNSQAASTADTGVAQPPGVSGGAAPFSLANGQTGSSILLSATKLRAAKVWGSASTIALSNVTSTNADIGVTGVGLTKLSISQSTFTGCSVGVSLSGGASPAGALTVDGTTLGCDGVGISASDRATVQVTGSNFTGGGADLQLSGRAWRSSVAGSTSKKGVVTAWLIGQSLIGTTTLDPDVTYRANGTIPFGSRVVVPAGTVLKMDQGGPYSLGVGFMVSGSLSLNGTADRPVIETAAWDDSVGGDSDGVPQSQITSFWESFTAVGEGGTGNVSAQHVTVLHGQNLIFSQPPKNWPYWGTPTGSGGRVDVSDTALGNANIQITNTDIDSLRVARITANSTAASFGGDNGKTDVSIEDSQLVSPGLNLYVGLAKSLTVTGCTFDYIFAGDMPNVSITDNQLVGSEMIGLSNQAVGATVLRNRAVDGSGGRVMITGTASGATLSSDLPYTPSGLTVNDLTIAAGVIVKAPMGGNVPGIGMTVAGVLHVNGTAANPVIFTALWDDTYGGDTDSAAPADYHLTSAQLRNSAAITISGSGQAIVSHAVMRNMTDFVLASTGPWYEWSTNAGAGVVDVSNSDLGDTMIEAEAAPLSTIRIANTVASGGGTVLNVYGTGKNTDVSITDSNFGVGVFYVQECKSLAVSRSSFSSTNVISTPKVSFSNNSLTGLESIYLANESIAASMSGDHAADGNGGSITLNGQAPDGTTLKPDLPYVPNVTVAAGQTVTIGAGAIIEPRPGYSSFANAFTVAGRLNVAGTAQKTVRFAALWDDAIGGDSDQVVGSGSASDSYFIPISLVNGGSASVSYADVRDSAQFVSAQNSAGSGSSAISVENSTVRSPIVVGTAIQSLRLVGNSLLAGATVDVLSNASVSGAFTIENNRVQSGINLAAATTGTVSIRHNDFSGATSGIQTSYPVSLEANWWGSSSGPGAPGATNFAGAADDADPWCIDSACAVLSDAPPVAFTTAPVPAISGTATVGSKLTAVRGVWAPVPTTWSYQWNRGGAPIPGATASTYVLTTADAGATVSVTVTGARVGNVKTAKTSAAVTVASLAFISTPDPTVSGTAAVGSTLTATAGVWAPVPTTLSYQWNRGSTPIAGAVSATYVLGIADAGTTISVTVTATRAGRVTTAKTSATVAVPLVAFTTVPVPTITGTAVVGSTLTATAGAWSPQPTTLSYQWKRGGAPIAGATSAVYLLTEADAGSSITVTVTGARAGYVKAAKASRATSIPALVFTTAPVPTISGAATVGLTLTASAGAWAPAPTAITYQWNRAGAPISGATAPTYALGAADVGASITVTVTAVRSGYVTGTTTSAAVVVGAATFTAAAVPTITGVATVGSTLTAAAGAWNPVPAAFSYQWKRGATAISGATGATYVLTAADAGASITVTVTGVLAGYASTTLTSVASAVGTAFVTTPTPTVSGQLVVGRTLTATVGAWAPVPTTTALQWNRNGIPIAGATAATYVLTAADAGARLSVTVRADKAGSATTTKTSLEKVVAAS